MNNWLRYLFVFTFLLLSFIQFMLFYNTYNLKQDELYVDIQKIIHNIKYRIEKHESERHKLLFEQYKLDNLCGNTYYNKNFDLTFRIAPSDSFSNLKELTDIISKKLANQALQSGSFLIASLALDSSYIDQISNEELKKVSKNITYNYLLSPDSIQTNFVYNYKVLLFDDYRLYHPMYLFLNVTGLSKMLFKQITLMLIICLFTMLMLFIITRYAYFSVLKFKKISEDKADFISHLAHEIKTPLSSIYISSQALNDKRIVNNYETIEHYSSIIFLEAEKLNKQLEYVLTISAADKNFLDLKMEEVNIHKLIIQVSELFIKRIALQNGKMNLCLNASLNIYTLDKLHFGNVLYNLFDNAIKYSSSNNINIKVETYNIDNEIVINIQDEGHGISDLDQQKIFNLFYRKDNNLNGFGIGLHYVKKIMQYHNGKIELKSKIGLGTTFSLDLIK
jgi:signal transduction histidine kinase